MFNRLIRCLVREDGNFPFPLCNGSQRGISFYKHEYPGQIPPAPLLQRGECRFNLRFPGAMIKCAAVMRGALTWVLVQLLLAMAVMLPFDETASAAFSATPWNEWAASPANWITWPTVGTSAAPVAVPRDNFQLIGSGTFTPGATGGMEVSAKMISGDKWITLGKETVGTLGISNQQISSAMQHFPANAMYVFAQYSPENATGHIEIQKVEKAPNGQVLVYQAEFTPWSGELWKAQGKYRTAAEIAAGASGYNPFAIFAGATTDPLFHNIGWQAMMVAVGHAMRHYGAAYGFVAVDQPSITQSTSTDSSLFSTTVTTTVDGYAKPLWYVATAMEATPSGQTGQICVTGGAGATTSGCDDSAHVAIAGVMFSPWQGGNMPQDQNLLYQYVNSQSSWNVLFFTVLFMIVTWGMAAFLAPDLIVAAGGDAAFAGGAAGGYAIASTVFGSGGSILQSQQGFFGATGNGWEAAVAPQNLVQQGLMNAVEADHVAPQIGNSGLSGVKTLYAGQCGAGFTVGQCRQMGLDPGVLWRPDSYAEYNSTKAMRQRYQSCIALGDQGGLGYAPGSAEAEQCAAPALQAIQP